MKMFRRLSFNRDLFILVFTLMLFFLVGLINGTFISVDTLLRVLNSSLVLILVAAGATLVILTKGIDVSIGATLGLSAIIFGSLLNGNMPPLFAFLLCLSVGASAGLFNGVMVAVFRIPPIIATLGSLGLYRGIALLYSGGSWIESVPFEIKQLSTRTFGRLSIVAWLTLSVVAAMYLFLRYHRWGRYFYLTGSNEDAARLLGIPVKTVQLTAFVGSGVLAALAGVVFTSQIGFIPTQAGSGIELRAIGASVIGGVSLLGGTGTVLGAATGAYFLTSIDSILVSLKFPAYWNDLLSGVILLLVLIFDQRLPDLLNNVSGARKRSVPEMTKSQTSEQTLLEKDSVDRAKL